MINSDQGSQFTSELYINLLQSNNIDISMDGRGRAKDNIYIERFWRTIKHDYIYRNPSENGTELWCGMDRFIQFYNEKRPHQSLLNRCPIDVYRNCLQKAA
jgi:putative transposase